MDNREKTLDDFFKKNDSTQRRKYTKDVKKEPDKIGEYFDSVTTKKVPKKKTFTDKLIDFFRFS